MEEYAQDAETYTGAEQEGQSDASGSSTQQDNSQQGGSEGSEKHSSEWASIGLNPQQVREQLVRLERYDTAVSDYNKRVKSEQDAKDKDSETGRTREYLRQIEPSLSTIGELLPRIEEIERHLNEDFSTRARESLSGIWKETGQSIPKGFEARFEDMVLDEMAENGTAERFLNGDFSVLRPAWDSVSGKLGQSISAGRTEKRPPTHFRADGNPSREKREFSEEERQDRAFSKFFESTRV